VVNLGYLLNDSVYHPGDSFDVPEGAQVDTLFVPVSGPWLKLSDSVEFVRAVRPRRAYALHDGLLGDVGLQVYNSNLARLVPCEYARLEPGTVVD
jgi:L-ascorbate metabolism protein UlaG (beta-lactamase superfamily)